VSVPPLVRIPVGVIVERTKSSSQWTDYLWRPVAVLPGVPDAAPWTKLAEDGERTTFYAGGVEIELYSSDTTGYRDNLVSGATALWVALRAAEGEQPYALLLVTADPSEGEKMTETGSDLVEPVPMPDAIRETLAAFVAEHHVERVFYKRKRERANPEALARREPHAREDRKK
jgi:hypothetical protein